MGPGDASTVTKSIQTHPDHALQLLTLINDHPLKHNGNAPLFLGYSSRLGKNHPPERIAVELTVHRLGKHILNRDGVHPHLPRHGRATQLSKFLTEN